jgi:hypothetical protein
LFHVVTDSIKHSPDLLINALAQNNANSGRTNGIKPRYLGALTIEKDSPNEFLRERIVPWSIQRDLVLFLDFEARVSELLREVTVIRQEE